ncbi:MAG: hypothetical protein H3Z53_05945 [archaeon]|nr:hypothetical protein [archaeon]
MSEPKNEEIPIVFCQEYPSAIETYPLMEGSQFENIAMEKFGVENRQNPKEIRQMLLEIEKRINELKEIPSKSPPMISPSLYAKLNARFLARITARRYSVKGGLKTYAMDIGAMNGKVFLFLVIELIRLEAKQRIVKLAPLSSAEKAPNEWLEGIDPSLLRSLLPVNK